MEPRLLKEEKARAYMGGISHGAFFRLRQAGVIRCVKAGKAVYFDIADLDAAIERLRERSADGGE